MKKLTDRPWYKLDNAAKIFTAVISRKHTTIFRISSSLKDPIDRERMQKALNRLVLRCPYFKVRLRRGLFWYYFDDNNRMPVISKDPHTPCMYDDFTKDNDFPFRVYINKNTIACEFTHYITDGTGAIIFLNSLLAEYFKLAGITIPDFPDVLNCDDTSPEEESKYAFLEYYKRGLPPYKQRKRAFLLPFRLVGKNRYSTITGEIPLDTIQNESRKHGVSITAYITAVLFYSLQDIFVTSHGKKEQRYPIKVLVPVNLRNMFPSKTMRNFSLSTSVEIDPRLGAYTLEELIQKVSHSMKYVIDEKFILQQLAYNVVNETKPLVRIIPLFIKNLFLSGIYNRTDKCNTSIVSNLGRILAPPAIIGKIENFNFILPPSPNVKIKCSFLSFNGLLYVTFAKSIEETDIERMFFTSLIKNNIPVKILK
ncbi:hypothetical protein ACFL6D_02550 [Spirochaetota bacterium]